MARSSLIIVFLVWSLILGAGSFFYGQHVQANSDVAGEVKQDAKDEKVADKKRTAAVQAGIRTEQAQVSTDTFFQHLSADYENQQLSNPGIGCVLDPVSLRVWNNANAQSDSDAPGEPSAEVQPAATIDGGPERGTEPRRDDSPAAQVQQ